MKGPGRQDQRNLLDLHPRALFGSEERAGQVVIVRPRFGSGRIGRFLARVARVKTVRTRLDEKGAFVWRLCDGRHDVLTIANQFARRYEGEEAGAIDRCAQFVRMMARAGLVELSPHPSPATAEDD